MEIDNTLLDGPRDLGDFFDRSYGCLCNGSVYYWKNRWGGKTFISSGRSGELHWVIACSNDGQVAITKDYDLAEEDYSNDGNPGILPATIDDLADIVSLVVSSFVFEPSFIDTFLTPERKLSEEESIEFSDYLNGKKVVPSGVKEHIKSMEYNDFLKTPYWKEIAKMVKISRNGRCQLCGSTKKLEVHHADYSVHGDEINNTDKLTVLCHKCHAKFHDK